MAYILWPRVARQSGMCSIHPWCSIKTLSQRCGGLAYATLGGKWGKNGV